MRMVLFLRTLSLVFALAASGSPVRADAIDHKPTNLNGDYIIYSGDLDDMHMPKDKDAKLSISISGRLADKMFNYLGREAQTKACVPNSQEQREKNSIACTRDLANGQTVCYIGFNLQDGKPIAGSIC